MLLCEGLEILALLGSFFNSQIQFDMVRLGNLFIFGFQFMLTRNLVVYILTPFHKISGATEKKSCQFIVACHGVGVGVVASRGNR